MKKQILIAAALLSIAVLGFLAGRAWTPDSVDAAGSDSGGDREILYWVAPMDSDFRRDEPGKSPMGMDLVPMYADQVDSQPGVVMIDPTVVNNLGVRTAVARRSPLPRLIEESVP